MYKNQLQELAQRSCFNLPSYASTREGPDHAPRFKASVNFNGEVFECPSYSNTLRQAEHAAAEVALNSLSSRGPSRSLTARVLDETGVYKNLLQETAHRAGLKLPMYTTIRSGPGHVPVFTSTVELAGMNFSGEPGKSKKQAEKNAAIAAWSALKKMPSLGFSNKGSDDQDHVIVGRVLSSLGRRRQNESRAVYRRKEQFCQTRRTMQQQQSSSSTSNSSVVWKLRDPLFSESGSGNCGQKQNSFLSLLPPPPPRTMSMILPPPMVVNSEMSHEQRRVGNDHDHDWMNRLSEGIIKVKRPSIELECSRNSSPVYSPFPVPNVNAAAAKLSFLLPDCSTLAAENSRIQNAVPQFKGMYGCNANEIGRSTLSGVCQPQRIAPAVQIRSVVPVCAAPPVRLTPSKQSNNESTIGASSLSSLSSSSEQVASTLSKLKL